MFVCIDDVYIYIYIYIYSSFGFQLVIKTYKIYSAFGDFIRVNIEIGS